MKGNKSKYKLAVDYVIDGINEGRLKKGAWIPSLNKFREMYGLSHDTAFSGIRELKSRDIIKSDPGAGCYIVSTRVPFRHDILLLFNEFNESKEDICNPFMKTVGNSATVDFYSHDYSRKVFETLVNNANHKYIAHIIISGRFVDTGPLLESLSGNIFLLDHYYSELKGKYSSVFQNLEKNTYEALVYGLSNLRKHKHIVMVQGGSKKPFGRYDGLRVSYREHGSTHKCISKIQGREIVKQEVFVVVNNRDLVNLSRQADRQQLVLGKNFSIIFYDDTPLEEASTGGIIILSTDFKLMGRTMASLISKKTTEVIENPWNLDIRNSL